MPIWYLPPPQQPQLVPLQNRKVTLVFLAKVMADALGITEALIRRAREIFMVKE